MPKHVLLAKASPMAFSGSSPLTPHVLIFPLPIQGHLNSMLKLAELLSLANLKVTFLNSAYNHQRLQRHTDIESRYPGVRFEVIPDGLPEDHPRTSDRVMELFRSLELTAKAPLREILMGLRDDLKAPVTCFIVDGMFGFAYDVGEEVGVPVVAFRTISACCFWVYFCIPKLLEAGEIPFKDENMDELVKNVPGMETLLRRRDLPSFCQAKDLSNPSFGLVNKETQRTKLASSLILNTFEELEGPILSLIRTHCSSNVYSVGPLHAQMDYRLKDKRTSKGNSVNSLWEVDRSCMKWLDEKPKKSVIYVSFGSVTTLSNEQLVEFWVGLVRSNKFFLWVIRPDSITGKDGTHPIDPEILEGTKERGYMVGWAPQEEVLAHLAIGGFLTHSGWNSTLESIAAGVPMLCWPYFADQQVNSRYVSEEWKIGLDMKDRCDRETVEKMVNDLMEERTDELGRSMAAISRSAKRSVAEGGTSYCNLGRLVNDIKTMTRK